MTSASVGYLSFIPLISHGTNIMVSYCENHNNLLIESAKLLISFSRLL